MRIRTMPYRPKLVVLIIVVIIVLITNRTIFYIRSSIEDVDQAKLKTLKKLAKDESLATVNRISAKFAPFQQKQIQENFMQIEQLQDAKTSVGQPQSEKKLQPPVQYGKDSYLKYFKDTNDNDIQDSFVNLHNYGFILNNKHACNKNVLVLVLINSDPRKYKERKLIRDTWGSVRFYSGANIVPLFILAKVEDQNLQDKIVLESKTNLDIIQGNFIDSYRNLTYKCVMGLHWVQKYCNHTKFVVKVDDDTLIDIYHLVRFLLQKSPDGNVEDFLYCSIYHNQGPRRTKDDKWFVPESEYPYSKYPPYCEGFAYVMSYDVTKKLYHASREVKFYWIDDVYITGFAALKAGVFQRNMESGHGYNLLESEHLSKNVQSSMFLLAKYEHLRKNWGAAWNDIKSFHQIE
ncbi:beta-1,3-galactosyltransferase 1-like isoform X2 [Mercenaria mercenaria]|nr:beta-1,3-galactosyltransferase 1-like isoform X2 [Mercenaria mercenaria]XP_053393047.1 beta-1,3-galactosyltransferase 1-like isoform X2 [Mercenaria mercenaria]XP_053393048.1 beta-1,3-galactosyltransferase 1-like isoform X2 [Mercenaria mercenaria]